MLSFMAATTDSGSSASAYGVANGLTQLGSTIMAGESSQADQGTSITGGLNVIFSFGGLKSFISTLNLATRSLDIRMPKLPEGMGDPVLYRQTGKDKWVPVEVQSYGDWVLKAHLVTFGYYQIFAPIVSLPYSFGDVYVFPNPTKNGDIPTLHVEVGLSDNVTTRIYDVAGDLVYEKRIDDKISLVNGKPSYEHAMDPSLFKSGVYVGVVTAEKAGKETIRKKYRFSVMK